MTTSFAYVVRGRILAAIYAQPLGAFLAVLIIMAFWAGVYISITGRPAHRLLQMIPTWYYLVPLSALLVLAWTWKIWIQARETGTWGY